MIKTVNLHKTYHLGGTVVQALDGVDISIDEGEMVAITGSSGSGKSTLMHILGCLDRPDDGAYFLANYSGPRKLDSGIKWN
jgi:putative ABC transport system ATP-binding protein